MRHLVSKKKSDTPTRANSISDVPCGSGLTLGRTTFTIPIFLGGIVLDEAARLAAVFAFLAIGFFDTSAMRFSFAA
jgi:hypothetical protein